MKETTQNSFQADVLDEKLPVLVDFWAPWCGPCRTLAPILADVAKELEGKAVVVKINIDDHGDIASKYKITSIPTMFLFKNGEVAGNLVGVQPKQKIIDFINK